MGDDSGRRASVNPHYAPAPIPRAPPLPAPRPLQLARDTAYRLVGYPSKSSSVQHAPEQARLASVGGRYASLGATQNASASHKTGLEINTVAINEPGTHALLGGKDIFKTVKVEDGTCVEDLNLRTAIRSRPTDALGQPRQVQSIDIADVAWAKGDCGDYVAAATSSGKIVLYDLGHAGVPAAQLHEHDRQVHKVTFNPHRGNLLLSGSQDGTVRLWDLRDVHKQASTLQSKRKYSGQSDGVRDVKWSPTDGVDFGFGTDSGFVQCWDMRHLKTAKVKIPAHTLACNIIDWHPDGKHIASASTDKIVRVWDVSGARRGKAAWEIQTPYPILNARWRPSCESSMPEHKRAKQCTQLVTAYDREHPIVHLWDFRRPAMPFREMAPYLSAPSDLLWHSQDLLWTVGREGIFLQSDIQHAPKVIDKRNLQSIAVSVSGEVNLVVAKRSQRRLPELPQASIKGSQPTNIDLSASLESKHISRSWQDDSLDHSFLSFTPSRHHSRANSGSKMGSISADGQLVAFPTLNLDEILRQRNFHSPQQCGVRGFLPHHIEPEVLKYLAKHYVHTTELTATIDDRFLGVVEEAFNHNADAADTAGLYKLAQTWRIIHFATSCHLKARAKHQLEKLANPKSATMQTPRFDLRALTMRLWAENNRSAMPSPASLRPITSLLQQQLALHDSTSDLPTPLVRPITSTVMAASRELATLPDPDKGEQIALPPSLAPSSADKRLTVGNLTSLEQQGGGVDSADLVRRWSIHPKEPFSLDPVNSHGVKVPPKLVKHDSDESFPFIIGSTESRGPSMPASVASNEPLRMVAERPSRQTVILNEPSDVTAPFEDINKIENAGKTEETAPVPRAASLNPDPSDDLPVALTDGCSEDLEESKPFRLVVMLHEMLKHYCDHGNSQFATHLLNMLVPLLPPSKPLSDDEIGTTALHYAETYISIGFPPDEAAGIMAKLQHTILAGLQPLQIEAILSTYHEQLMANQLFLEAAHLRKLAYPTYPAVYEDALKDNTVAFRGANGGGKAGIDCPYCGMKESPFGASLLTACLECGHVAHMACLGEWLGNGEGYPTEGCPTEGCLCACTIPSQEG
ncbi:hypothetical protein BAUCODRAFT_29866 [Baudoinia panamericana UAMH 10762]|uniref:Uncharacterized protein n=1 Tax=Baudoinia panamericana (strain UAMH 10762) TaxID=717646 RepID=M2NJF8_BAUPA|nr:uncharacterized protein BAUCODRAFT_29866 [Baudoinia panamericana UAMH 10762]EMC99519.1 hypothetical protein BAUCODRAFT_29866 [Baudoinia panamericana UAMH 10762]